MKEALNIIVVPSINGISRIKLNEPKTYNALSSKTLKSLINIFKNLNNNNKTKVIIIEGLGKGFSAGHDLKEMTRAREASDCGKDFFVETMATCAQVMQTIVNHPKPVIAEITGVATAAGCQLVASCDLAYAAPTARFGTPGVNIGLFCSTPMVALSRNVSNKNAMEMLLSGDLIDAETAATIGLINRVVPEETLSEYAMGVAVKIASKSSMTLTTGKQAFYRQREMTLGQAYEYTSQIMVENMLTHDAEEGINAFIEKRAPQWQDQ